VTKNFCSLQFVFSLTIYEMFFELEYFHAVRTIIAEFKSIVSGASSVSIISIDVGSHHIYIARERVLKQPE
jgi:hypothetical protein